MKHNFNNANIIHWYLNGILTCISPLKLTKKRTRDPGIQDVRAKYKQNWINHLEKMDTTRLPKHDLNYKPRG
jgi:hypothetical protein